MVRQCVLAVRLEKFGKIEAFRIREARTDSNVLQRARVIKQAQQQRTHQRAIAFLVPAKTSHHAIAIALVLYLEHDALVRLISSREWLRDHPIKSRALKAPEPVRSNVAVTRRRRQMDRRSCSRNQSLQFPPSHLERLAAKVTISHAQQIETNKRTRSLLRQELHTRSCRMQAQLQQIKIEFVVLNDDDLTI